MARSNRFDGKTVLVAGGARGMGREAAQRFASEGGKVAIFDTSEAEAREAVAAIEHAGGVAAAYTVDVTQPDQVAHALELVEARFGSIDVLFNVAGTIVVKPLHETELTDFDHLMNVNVRSAFIMCKAVLPSFLRAGGGSIVIMASISGLLGFANESVYNMSKAATLMLAKSIAAEYRVHNVRANAVCPAFVDTAHGRAEIAAFEDLGHAWDSAALAAKQLRISLPQDIAPAVLFLASDEAAFINGVGLSVDNGWHAIGG